MSHAGIDIKSRTSRADWLSRAEVGLNVLPLVLIAAIVAGYALRLINPPTLWLDEAMLYVNIRDIAWSELLSPLPFYDQAAPVAYIALLKLIHGLAGLQETLLRLPSWAALIATLALIARLPDTDRTERILIAAMMAGSFVIARIATDAKPYMFEAMFAFAMMIAFYPGAQGFCGRTSFRVALLTTAMLTTTAFPLVAFAVGAPVILITMRADLTSVRELRQWHSIKPAAIFAAALALYALYFVGYLSPGLKLIAANHAYGYGPSGFAPDGAFYLHWLARRISDIIAGHWQTAAPVVAIAAIVGAYSLARSTSIGSKIYVAQAAALLGAVILANLTGHFPIMEERFSVFMLPWLTLLAATGLALAVRQLTSKPARSVVLTGITAALLLPAIGVLKDPFHQQARASFAQIRSTPAIPLVTTMAGQPIIDAYQTTQRDKRTTCAVTAAAGTTTRCTAARTPGDGTFSGPATKWYLMNYIAVASWGGSDHGFPGTSIETFSADYYDWITDSLRRHPRAHLLIVQGNKHILTALRARLKPNESLTRIVDERPPSPTLAHSAAQLFEFESE